ncbi:MAG: PKD domain-containing protein [Methanomassiliicoccaceae archaeon]|nr:PKD domain-containing protein [Methanomassiliicoccaceae archaeon]
MKNKKKKFLGAFAASMMLCAAFAAVIASGHDGNADDEYEPLGSQFYSYNLLNMPRQLELKPGDILRVHNNQFSMDNSHFFIAFANAFGNENVRNIGGGLGTLEVTVTLGVFNVNFPGTFSSLNFSVDVFFNVTFNFPAGGQQIVKSYGTVQLLLFAPLANYEARWFNAHTGGTQIGIAGQTISVNTDLILWGRYVQTSAYFNPAFDTVRVSFMDSLTYTLSVFPSNATLTHNWANTNITQPVTISGNIISINQLNLPSGTHELRVTASQAGLASSTFRLFIEIPPVYWEDLRPHNLSPWSYTISTLNPNDTIGLIQATRTESGVTAIINPALVGISPTLRVISFNFTEAGQYEFILRLIGPTGVSGTHILRLYVSDAIVPGIPSIDGITVLSNGNGNFDFILQNPSNFATILWNFGDGRVEQNQSTTRNYTYGWGDVFTVTVTLINSFGDEATASTIANNLVPNMPDVALRTVEYIALVAVAATNAIQVKVVSPDWLSWEFIPAGSNNFVRITGTFYDGGLVGTEITISVYSNGILDKTGTITLRNADGDFLEPNFILQRISNSEVRIMYTGSWDGGTTLTVQWAVGGSHGVILPNTWYYWTYTENGTFTITVTALRFEVPVSISRTVTIEGVVHSSFLIEPITNSEIRIKFNGTQDDGIIIMVRWTVTGNFAPFNPDSEGWMHHTYTFDGQHTITVTAALAGVSASTSQTISITGTGNTGPNAESVSESPLAVIAVILLGIFTLIACLSGRYTTAFVLGILTLFTAFIGGVI